LSAGDCFGEIVFAHWRKAGRRRCRPKAIVTYWKIGKPVMADVIRDTPDCLERLSELLASAQIGKRGRPEEAASHALNRERSANTRPPFCTVCGLFLSFNGLVKY